MPEGKYLNLDPLLKLSFLKINIIYGYRKGERKGLLLFIKGKMYFKSYILRNVMNKFTEILSSCKYLYTIHIWAAK